tara:strand:+ start:86 stop:634 length:549 start_codon:yes stop_codon:yes gene_type:complete
MSRIGKKLIEIPENVDFSFKDGIVSVSCNGKSMSLNVGSDFKFVIKDSILELKRSSEAKEIKSKHGLFRSLVFNMIEGLSKGYTKELELHGVGFRASNQGQKLDISLGYSHNIVFEVCPEVKVETQTEKGSNPKIILKSHDKQLLGQVCAKIRSFRKHDPYKGKGIRFVGERVRRKAGKTTA